MFNDLQNIIDIDSLKSNFILIESNNIDGTFVLHHLLSYCIKREFKTLFLTLSQTLSHYKSIQTKLGNTNKLTKLIETGIIKHIDCLKLVNYDHDGNDDEFINLLFKLVNENLTVSHNYEYLIIDDLTIAYLLTNKLNIKKFYQFIINIKNTYTNLKIIVYMQSFNNNVDSALSNLIKDFSYLSDLYFNLSQLETGYSKDIHGQVCNIHS